MIITSFQSTPPRGWRQRYKKYRLTTQKFQSTPPRGWTHYRLHMHLHISFQSTPPRGWRHGIRMPKPRFCTFQSTPPRGWRQGTVWIAVRAYDISIHSTARVETHTLWLPVLGQYDFNPLHREGGDTKRVRENQRARISIHSTARVETAAAAISFCSSADFNPLHREGGDPCWRP